MWDLVRFVSMYGLKVFTFYKFLYYVVEDNNAQMCSLEIAQKVNRTNKKERR